jgi:hypothetical protein
MHRAAARKTRLISFLLGSGAIKTYQVTVLQTDEQLALSGNHSVENRYRIQSLFSYRRSIALANGMKDRPVFAGP